MRSIKAGIVRRVDSERADLSEADYARILERIRAGKPTQSSADRRKKNGEIVRVALKTTPLVDTQGKLIGEITVARAIVKNVRPSKAPKGPGSNSGHRARACSSQAPTAAVDNSAPSPTRPESTYKSGKVVQTNGATSK